MRISFARLSLLLDCLKFENKLFVWPSFFWVIGRSLQNLVIAVTFKLGRFVHHLAGVARDHLLLDAAWSEETWVDPLNRVYLNTPNRLRIMAQVWLIPAFNLLRLFRFFGSEAGHLLAGQELEPRLGLLRLFNRDLNSLLSGFKASTESLLVAHYNALVLQAGPLVNHRRFQSPVDSLVGHVKFNRR